VEFTVNGESYELRRQQVEEAMKGVEPERIRQHVVEVDGRHFPIKQVLEVVLHLDRLDFNTQQARSILRRLAFTVTKH